MSDRKPIHFLVGNRKGQSKRFFVRSVHPTYAEAVKVILSGQTIVASRENLKTERHIPVYLAYRSTMRKEYGLTDLWLEKMGGPDHQVRNPHYSSAAPASLFWLGRCWAEVCRLLGGSLSEKRREKLEGVSELLEEGIKRGNQKGRREEKQREREILRKLEEEKVEIDKYNQILLRKITTELSSCEDSMCRRLLIEHEQNPVDLFVQLNLFKCYQRYGYSLRGVVSVTRNFPGYLNGLVKRVSGGLDLNKFIGKLQKKYRRIPPSTGLLEAAEWFIIEEDLKFFYKFVSEKQYADLVRGMRVEEKRIKEQDKEREEERVKRKVEKKDIRRGVLIRFQTLPQKYDRFYKKVSRALEKESVSEGQMVSFVVDRYRTGPKGGDPERLQEAARDLLRATYGSSFPSG